VQKSYSLQFVSVYYDSLRAPAPHKARKKTLYESLVNIGRWRFRFAAKKRKI
jgi:hypothetical protein